MNRCSVRCVLVGFVVCLTFTTDALAMYHPQLGRFLNRDPIEADIINNYRYCQNSPVTNVDPEGELTVTPVGSNLNIRCGDRPWIRWDFKLDKNAPCDGYIVQQVDVRCTINACENCPQTSPLKPDFSYWEAFFVKKGETVDESRTNRAFKYTDESIGKRTVDNCGNLSMIGKIKFFCKTTTGDLGKDGEPNNFSGWNRRGQPYGKGECSTTAGSLPSNQLKPSWWDNKPVEGPSSRWFSEYWCCCNRPGDFAIASANPK